MEHFFIDDKFYNDLSDLIDEMEIKVDNIHELPDDWSQKIQLSKLEKIFTLDKKFVADAIMQKTQTWEERFPEDPSDRFMNDIQMAVENGIDIDKMNAFIPELYYPTMEFVTITKQDLIDWIN